MNIVCLKWGDKFGHEHVNRLYRMVCKNFHADFNFICHTENANGIDRNVIIQPLPDYDLENWWWKLTLFQYSTKVPTLFFDLDVVIQNDITHFKDYAEDSKIRVIRAYWKKYLYDEQGLEPYQKLNPSMDLNGIWYDMDINSSIMIWKGDCTWAWDSFFENLDYYLIKYKGIDSFLYYHFFENLTCIPKGQVYSRGFGIDELGNPLDSKYYYDSNYNVCIVNGWKGKDVPTISNYLENAYCGLEHYWD